MAITCRKANRHVWLHLMLWKLYLKCLQREELADKFCNPFPNHLSARNHILYIATLNS